jgi:CBS domain-containing protein
MIEESVSKMFSIVFAVRFPELRIVTKACFFLTVKDAMMETPYYCQPENNLGSATELMWNANCGFLPVQSTNGKVIGVITDRDICIALGTRNRPAAEVNVGEVMSGKLYTCAPDDDIHTALQTMKEAKIRRLPVMSENGTLVGVLSTDDILFRAETPSPGKEPELSTDEVARTFRSIAERGDPEVKAKRAAAGEL